MPSSAEDLRRDFEARLNTKSSESFAIVDNESGKAIGATSFLDIREGDRHLEIGAKFEGLLRNQRLERDGSWRTAAYYSVIVEEWPETKAHLLKLLGRD